MWYVITLTATLIIGLLLGFVFGCWVMEEY